mmetsp:Transcript_54863/g.164189  ORF Transcript_54863/g.164189 Transcript_54863/m.164189 type:complete len:541 (+) Transcript_54863:1576-3198(+)
MAHGRNAGGRVDVAVAAVPVGRVGEESLQIATPHQIDGRARRRRHRHPRLKAREQPVSRSAGTRRGVPFDHARTFVDVVEEISPVRSEARRLERAVPYDGRGDPEGLETIVGAEGFEVEGTESEFGTHDSVEYEGDVHAGGLEAVLVAGDGGGQWISISLVLLFRGRARGFALSGGGGGRRRRRRGRHRRTSLPGGHTGQHLVGFDRLGEHSVHGRTYNLRHETIGTHELPLGSGQHVGVHVDAHLTADHVRSHDAPGARTVHGVEGIAQAEARDGRRHPGRDGAAHASPLDGQGESRRVVRGAIPGGGTGRGATGEEAYHLVIERDLHLRRLLIDGAAVAVADAVDRFLLRSGFLLGSGHLGHTKFNVAEGDAVVQYGGAELVDVVDYDRLGLLLSADALAVAGHRTGRLAHLLQHLHGPHQVVPLRGRLQSALGGFRKRRAVARIDLIPTPGVPAKEGEPSPPPPLRVGSLVVVVAIPPLRSAPVVVAGAVRIRTRPPPSAPLPPPPGMLPREQRRREHGGGANAPRRRRRRRPTAAP